MKFLLRFLFPLAIVLGGLAYLLLPLVDHLTTKWFVRDLDIRSRLIVNALQDEIAAYLADGGAISQQKIASLLKKATQDDRLLALGICSPSEKMIFKTEMFPDVVNCSDIRQIAPHLGVIKTLPNGDVHIAFGYIERVPDSAAVSQTTASDVKEQEGIVGKLVLLHDMSFASRRSSDTKFYLFMVFIAIGLVIAIITVIIARWSMATWIKSVRQLVGGIRTTGIQSRHRLENREFLPILKDLRGLVRDLDASARAKDETQITWNRKTIKGILTDELSGDEVIVLSNRQPYIHNHKGQEIEVQSPASGLVTAIEPIVKACSGVWIAHGNGTADRDVVDKTDRIRVPPEKPQYEIHRVWLSREQEQGYYYGFSNEGLWPLCHISHTRPVFRQSDWEKYVEVNSKFVDAIVRDSKTDDPVVLVQDYHFALVPKLLRSKLPKATIITFWHIPWPNPESFGICPWRELILEGLLGSSIVGFHTQFHCNNFTESVDRFLESRIDRETNSISYGGKITEIRPYPISIEWPPERLAGVANVAECRRSVRMENSLPEALKIGIGIDRLDYTKGIIERFRAVERLLELQPHWIGQFSFIQLAAPSRSSIAAYQQFEAEVRAVAQQINSRFGFESYSPIVLKISHHEPEQVFRHFRAAELCFVTSLHDGMNLVAKEFVASRDDEGGVLILSMFAGASRELAESLIINPYDADQSAMALDAALTMSPKEQKERMRILRSIVKEYNVYRWAGRMLLDAARMRRRSHFAKQMRRLTHSGRESDGPAKHQSMVAHLPLSRFVGRGGHKKI